MNFELIDQMKKTVKLLEAINKKMPANIKVVDCQYIIKTIARATNPLIKIEKYNKRLIKAKIANSDTFIDLFEDWLAWVRSIYYDTNLVTIFLADLASCNRLKRL